VNTHSAGQHHGVPLGRLLTGFAEAGSAAGLPVTGLSLDSRKMRQGDLFCAIAGHQGHGLQYLGDVLARGPCAILYDPQGGGRELARGCSGTQSIAVESLHHKVGFIADRFFSNPSEGLNVIAVTGTNGKTSCSHFLANALGGGGHAAVIGTLGWGRPGELQPCAQTTPDAIEIHAMLARLKQDGMTSVALEASSHGLVQGRLNGVRARSALYTNITRDHLDYHGTLDAYVEAKLALLDFPELRSVAFNADDARACLVADRAREGIELIAFSRAGTAHPDVPTVCAGRVEQAPEGLRMEIRYAGSVAEVHAPVFGDYNAENLLGALAVLLGMGYGLSESAERLAMVRPVPGRMEHVRSADGVTAIVDYAHTPDALDRVLQTLRGHCGQTLWVVFGCGGERDRGKRPLMGRVAERWADRVVVTDDNPRHEDGDAIVADILSGCQTDTVVVERDRRQAVEWVIDQAEPGDVVVVAGKGHERFQDLGSVTIPFDDRQVVREALQARAVRACC
jgi:UDP-N-acetylmuramoyl-L-alanyl-D-glutamate--2,6-diaminopimelate ligase